MRRDGQMHMPFVQSPATAQGPDRMRPCIYLHVAIIPGMLSNSMPRNALQTCQFVLVIENKVNVLLTSRFFFNPGKHGTHEP